MFDQGTIYKITDKHGATSTNTFDKPVADVLQMKVPDVHAWVQDAHDRVQKGKPERGRVKKGDVVRGLAQKEVDQYPGYDALVRQNRLAEL